MRFHPARTHFSSDADLPPLRSRRFLDPLLSILLDLSTARAKWPSAHNGRRFNSIEYKGLFDTRRASYVFECLLRLQAADSVSCITSLRSTTFQEASEQLKQQTLSSAFGHAVCPEPDLKLTDDWYLAAGLTLHDRSFLDVLVEVLIL